MYFFFIFIVVNGVLLFIKCASGPEMNLKNGIVIHRCWILFGKRTYEFVKVTVFPFIL